MFFPFVTKSVIRKRVRTDIVVNSSLPEFEKPSLDNVVSCIADSVFGVRLAEPANCFSIRIAVQRGTRVGRARNDQRKAIRMLQAFVRTERVCVMTCQLSAPIVCRLLKRAFC